MSSDLTSLWAETLKSIEKDLSKPGFQTWLKHSRPLALYGDTLIIGVPNDFARDWVESRYASLLQKELKSVAGREMVLKFVIPPPDPNASEQAATVVDMPLENGSTLAVGRPLNPKYTFDTFVVGPSNRFAHAAALAVGEAPAKAYNPLFIYGGVGLGKTHLMQAVGHFVLAHSPKTRVVYVSSETFTNELINAIRDHKTVEFRNRYRNVDVLLVDDIQFLAGKETTQEEFFHTFDALHAASKQIVISSDRPPREISTLEDRLRSRFEWGLISDIQPPDLETRIAILRKKAKLENLDIPHDVILFIATQFESNIRELEGALIRIVAVSSMTEQPIDLDLASRALKDMVPHTRSTKVTVDRIQKVVSEHYGLRLEDLKIKKRTRALAFPRQIAMYLCRELTDLSLSQIGEDFGRDHTTVIHACDKIAADMAADPALEAKIKLMKEQIKNGT